MTSRRGFLGTAGLLLAGSACVRRTGAPDATVAGDPGAPAVTTADRRTLDIVIRGGTVIDGSRGAQPMERDVGIAGGRVSIVAPGIRDSGRLEIDARGLVVTPGFIDIHSHGDGTMFADPRMESVVRQGITTIVAGQDGGSRAPTGDDAGQPAITGDAEERGRGPFRTLRDFFDAVDATSPGANVASMVGLGTVRRIVIGNADRPPAPDELRRMTALVEEALAHGACGASSGLEYIPGAFATVEELSALCRPLAAYGLPYATHMRNEDDHLLEAIDEAIAVARGAGCPLQISHLKTQGPRNWGKLDDAFARIERAHAAGLDVAFDRYPYIAYSTTLRNLFPTSAREGGAAAFLARLDDPATAPRLRQDALAKVESIGGWNNVMVTSVANAADRAAEGRRMGEYAAEIGADPYETTVGLLRRSRGAVGMVGFAMSEENIDRILAHPLGMVCSDGGAYAVDGPARRGHPHPRGGGSFPRVLGRYVHERRALTLEDAVWKMSGFAASRCRLRDRGRLASGFAADVVVFDPATVTDRATFTDPFQYPAGIRAVVVNGRVALQDGERGVGAGRALRGTETRNEE